jgi:hypothetical protein
MRGAAISRRLPGYREGISKDHHGLYWSPRDRVCWVSLSCERPGHTVFPAMTD